MDVRRISKKQEKRIAERLTKNVENAMCKSFWGLYHKKSDVISKTFRIEAKTKATPSSRLL